MHFQSIIIIAATGMALLGSCSNTTDQRYNLRPRPETIIVLAHGDGQDGALSNDRLRTITRSRQPLMSSQVISYMRGNAAPEYPTSSMGSLGPLIGDEWSITFGLVAHPNPAPPIPQGEGILDTGLRRGGDTRGTRTFALRGMECSYPELEIWSRRRNFKIILLACRDIPGQVSVAFRDRVLTYPRC